MRAFEYASPSTPSEAVQLLTDGASALPLAGGTDLLSLMKDDLVRPSRLVSLKSIAELRGIEATDAGLRIGAMTSLGQLLEEPAVASSYPALAHAARGIRSPQLHAMGTVGGELLQRPRCWYFRGGFGLLAQRDGSSMVAGGDNRYHAILGTDGPAYFVHPSSLAPALVALGASARIFGPEGPREAPIASLWRVPTAEEESEVTLGPGEILTDIVVPATRSANATYEVRQKEALDWPLVAAAVSLQVEGEKIAAARLVLGHVAPVPYDASRAAELLVGQATGDLDGPAATAAEAAVADARPLSGNGYKVQLAKVATRRAIERALGRSVP